MELSKSINNRSHFIILPTSLYDEFNEELKKLEEKNQLIRNGEVKQKSNKFGMTGDTYHISYEPKGGKYKAFCKELRILWSDFNYKHPKTAWKGK